MRTIEKFYKKHQTEIIIGGVLISVIAYKLHIKAVRRQAFTNGAIAGFQGTIDWFEKHFDDVHLRELWQKWAIENPDKIIYPK
jgi:hypothetical protein